MTELTVVTWNCKSAGASSGVWDYLLDQNPDIAFLQEVRDVPARVLAEFKVHKHAAMGKTGDPQRFSTAILVRGEIGNAFSLQGVSEQATVELGRFIGNLVCRELFPRNGPPLKAVSVYSPAWSIAHDPELWLTDLLLASLQFRCPERRDAWVIAGDFNLSETFDDRSWSAGGNREFLNCMSDLGLTECLRTYKGALTPTFQNPRGKEIIHQMDHIFVTQALATRLLRCDTGSRERVFGKKLSDHLPVIAVFNN